MVSIHQTGLNEWTITLPGGEQFTSNALVNAELIKEALEIVELLKAQQLIHHHSEPDSCIACRLERITF